MNSQQSMYYHGGGQQQYYKEKQGVEMMQEPLPIQTNSRSRKSGGLLTNLLIAFGITVFIVAVAVTGFFNFTAGVKKQSQAVIGKNNPTDPGFSGLILNTHVSNVDIPNFKYTVHFELAATGNFSTFAGSGLPNIPMTVIFDSAQTKTFNANAIMNPQDISFLFSTGDSNLYPFDFYTDSMNLAVFGLETVNGSTQVISVPIAVSSFGALQSFTIATSETDGDEAGQLSISTSVKRSATTIFFSAFIFVLSWILSSLGLCLAITLWTRGRKVEPPTIAVLVTMLFALPALRASQPGIPGIGSMVDVVGFFYNEAMVGVAVVLLLANYIVKYK